MKRRHAGISKSSHYPIMIGRSSLDSATGRVSLDALASTTITNRSLVLLGSNNSSPFISTPQNMMLHDHHSPIPESVQLPTIVASSSYDSDMESLSSEASVSSVGELFNEDDQESLNTIRVSTDQTRITTLSPLQNCFNLVATNLIETDSVGYPGTLSLSVQEDGEYLHSFYRDSFCRPFKIRVRISELSEKLPKGIYTDLVDSMTLLTIVKPYSVFSTNVIVREGTKNQFIGTISKDFLVSKFKVKSSNNKVIFRILHEKTKSETLHFYSIHDVAKKEQIGKIISKKGVEFFLDAPTRLIPEEKALLISALIFIVFTLHEDKKSKEFFQKNAKEKANAWAQTEKPNDANNL
ncbi:hypothetical protein C9374_010170 [Naegleria lovaniensis]|uniref:Uncharacterized protein n=1 Tax=Naegleria lovaniensis TaxID=51637 RepID=A0AA88GJ83_NAELO|nr:uncharacterized protein C9374_010170 [Naegleria lovaniensis]KAG2375166.1 hypothetical protein C9374_010170 [Naegleria lovaniensis]